MKTTMYATTLPITAKTDQFIASYAVSNDTSNAIIITYRVRRSCIHTEYYCWLLKMNVLTRCCVVYFCCHSSFL